jgi:hypothetical protein
MEKKFLMLTSMEDTPQTACHHTWPGESRGNKSREISKVFRTNILWRIQTTEHFDALEEHFVPSARIQR